MRQAKVYYKEELAGILKELDQKGYEFKYDKNYISSQPGNPITLTMPVRELPYTKDVLFPFFEGLIPEGWLLNIASENWKINKNDRMGLLLACCSNCIGAVSIQPILNPR